MADRRKAIPVIAVALCGITLAAAAPNFARAASTHEQIQENCRNTVGRPFVQSCMAGDKSRREECRAKASPQVRACVLKTEQGIAASKPPPAAPKDEAAAAAAKSAGPVPTTFAPPPRTIADI